MGLFELKQALYYMHRELTTYKVECVESGFGGNGGREKFHYVQNSDAGSQFMCVNLHQTKMAPKIYNATSIYHI